MRKSQSGYGSLRFMSVKLWYTLNGKPNESRQESGAKIRRVHLTKRFQVKQI